MWRTVQIKSFTVLLMFIVHCRLFTLLTRVGGAAPTFWAERAFPPRKIILTSFGTHYYNLEMILKPWCFPVLTCTSHSMHQQQDVLIYLSNWPRALQRRPGALKDTSKIWQQYSDFKPQCRLHRYPLICVWQSISVGGICTWTWHQMCSCLLPMYQNPPPCLIW